MYVLDTITVSDFLRGNQKVKDKLSTISKKWVYITSITNTKLEIEYGLKKKPELRPKLERKIELLYSEVGDYPFETQIPLPVKLSIIYSAMVTQLVQQIY